ncbi:MAG: hypothetical protein E5W93_16080, partial [Mesorhizobium sp.]
MKVSSRRPSDGGGSQTSQFRFEFPSRAYLSGVCAAPHLPAGILSPYSDGEREALIADFANLQRRKKDAEAAASPFS